MLVWPILLFVGGLLALIVGRMRLIGRLTISGQRARIAGLLLMLPLPASLLVNSLIIVRLGAPLGLTDPDVQFLTWMVDSLLFWAGLIGGLVYAHRAQPKPPDQPPAAPA